MTLVNSASPVRQLRCLVWRQSVDLEACLSTCGETRQTLWRYNRVQHNTVPIVFTVSVMDHRWHEETCQTNTHDLGGVGQPPRSRGLPVILYEKRHLVTCPKHWGHRNRRLQPPRPAREEAPQREQKTRIEFQRFLLRPFSVKSPSRLGTNYSAPSSIHGETPRYGAVQYCTSTVRGQNANASGSCVCVWNAGGRKRPVGPDG